MALLAADVAPGHHEHRVALLHRVRGEGVLGLQVEDVELVDARRHHDERPRRHLVARRAVLDELHHLVLVHHVAGGNAQIAADLERRIVGLADAALVHVGHQVGEAARQALAARGERFAHRRRVGRGEVGRAHRVEPLPRCEARALLRRLVQLGLVDQAFQVLGHQEIRLAQVVVVGVAAPLLGDEAAIALVVLDQRLGASRKEAGPEARLLVEVLRLQPGAVLLQLGEPRRHAHDAHPALRHFIA